MPAYFKEDRFRPPSEKFFTGSQQSTGSPAPQTHTVNPRTTAVEQISPSPGFTGARYGPKAAEMALTAIQMYHDYKMQRALNEAASQASGQLPAGESYTVVVTWPGADHQNEVVYQGEAPPQLTEPGTIMGFAPIKGTKSGASQPQTVNVTGGGGKPKQVPVLPGRPGSGPPNSKPPQSGQPKPAAPPAPPAVPSPTPSTTIKREPRGDTRPDRDWHREDSRKQPGGTRDPRNIA